MNRDERGDIFIYKVDQLTALRWSGSVGGDFSCNCSKLLSHTELFVSSTLPSVADQEEHMVERELPDAINIFPLRNPMANLLNLVE